MTGYRCDHAGGRLWACPECGTLYDVTEPDVTDSVARSPGPPECANGTPMIPLNGEAEERIRALVAEELGLERVRPLTDEEAQA